MTERDDPTDRHSDQQIDAALARTFAPRDADLARIVGRVAAAARPRPRTWAKVAAVAAVVLALGIAAAWLLASSGESSGNRAERREVAKRWQATYRDAVAHGYGSPSCCQPGVDLPSHCEARYSCPLQLCATPDVELCGVYCGALCKPDQGPGDQTVLLLRAGGEQVCVFVDVLARDPKPDAGALQGLKMHRRSLPPFVLYEVTKAESPRALDRFAVP